MERLTERNVEGKAIPKTLDFQLLINKLCEYEDLEEQEKLIIELPFIELPCKIGEPVYKIVTQRDSFDDQEYRIVTAVNFTYDKIPEIGKTIFLTDEEAEEKLEEMNNERN